MAKEDKSVKDAIKATEDRLVNLEREVALIKNNFRWSLAALILLVILMASPDSVIFRVIHMASEFKKALP